MKHILASLAVSAALLAPAALAQSPVLVELFASHNCRACPKANKTLHEVDADREDVFILTWSVDYWDYLGAKDPMAMVESEDRQRGYVDRFRLRGPYTPQTVYNGVEQCAGNKPANVSSALEKVQAFSSEPVKVAQKGDRITLDGKAKGLTDIWYIDYLDGEDNTTNMVHPVTHVTALGPWLGGHMELELPECLSHCVIVVQEAGFGPVLATLPLSR
ncbi:MAG: DUF1223 domain-containing protein [Hyphomonas sp.]|uniref:DUF1223 domain-containing protein n=1 Tax=Hyphomonas sp. TaxID=87 RepID=UPI0035280D92